MLNPEGINALRFFEGRGNRVWGARTMSSDPEWMYVNVRRLFIFLEHSIDNGDAVGRVRAEQRAALGQHPPHGRGLPATCSGVTGALLGAKPEEAYFVRCDRTTMTQNDLDNGRLICLIGVAPTKPAEFVIFRIGQLTADARGLTRGADRWPSRATTRTARSTSSSPSAATRATATRARSSAASPTSAGSASRCSYSEYRNGNEKVNTVRKVPNTFKLDDVTLKRGLVGSTDLFAWLKDVRDGRSTPRTVTISLLDEARQHGRHLEAAYAQPKKWTGPTLAAKGGGEVAMEELVLCHQGIEYR